MQEQGLADVSGVIFSRVAPVSGEENSGDFGTDPAAPVEGGAVPHTRLAHQ